MRYLQRLGFQSAVPVLLSCSLVLCGSLSVQADFTGGGDVTRDLDGTDLVNLSPLLTDLELNRNDGDEDFDDSGAGVLIVGNAGNGGIIGNAGLPFLEEDPVTFEPIDLKPLRSTTAIIGNQVGSFGAVTLEEFMFLPEEDPSDGSAVPGFTAPFGGNWLIRDNLTVGHKGVGNLDLRLSARVEAWDVTYVGGGDDSNDEHAPDDVDDSGFGLGEVTINGAATRLVNGNPGRRTGETRTTPGAGGIGDEGDLLVGFDERGRILVTGRGSIETLGNAFVGVDTGGDGYVSLSDQSSSWTVEGSLTVGNGRGPTSTAIGLVEISEGSSVSVREAVNVNTLGTVHLLGGTLKQISTDSAAMVFNSGLIRGDGIIDGDMTINAGGILSNGVAEVINGPTNTSFRETMRVTGEVINDGIVRSDGGKMIFDALVTNNNVIDLRNAIVDFRSTPPEDGTVDLVNTDLVVVGGDVTINGDIDNSGGDLFTLDNTTLLVNGNLMFTSGIFGMALNGEAPPVTVTGVADLGGATIDLELSSGFVPENGVLYEILVADDGVVNYAGGVDAAGGLIFNIAEIGGTLFASTAGVPVMPMGTDFNGDGIVNALDLQIWEDNFGSTGVGQTMGDSNGDGIVNGMDFLEIQMDFGGPPSPLSALATVPEPSTMVMGLMALVCCPRRRSRG